MKSGNSNTVTQQESLANLKPKHEGAPRCRAMQSAQICAETQKFECNTDEGGTATLEVTQQETLAGQQARETQT